MDEFSSHVFSNKLVSNFVTDFTPSFIPSFFTSGWMLSLDPNRVLIGWGEWCESSDSHPNSYPNQQLKQDKKNQLKQKPSVFPAIYAPDFYLKDKNPWKWTTHWSLIERDRFASLVLTADDAKVNSDIQQNASTLENRKNENLQWVEPSIDIFRETWLKIKLGFADRGLLKCVPVVFSNANLNFDSQRRLRALKSLLVQPKPLFLYGMWSEESGMMGASPELLFSQNILESQELLTVALAGTRSRNGVSGDDLKHESQKLVEDAKERREHEIVIDDIRAQLCNFGEVETSPTEVLVLPTLLHLKTFIRAKLKRPLSFLEKVNALHPTPALGVAPRAAGFAEMLNWDEPKVRARFGAPFGVCMSDIHHCIVAIRNVQWAGNQILLGSGCGIVAESQFDREWKELSLKRDSVKRMMDL